MQGMRERPHPWQLCWCLQCVRLAVHLGFCIRVKGVHKDTDLPLREEIIVMTERCSLYFTLGVSDSCTQPGKLACH